jgi:hypothetical protein
MFVYDILIETRIFGELIPFIVTATVLIAEDLLASRMTSIKRTIRYDEIQTGSRPTVIANAVPEDQWLAS